jgi:hypothetical protein
MAMGAAYQGAMTTPEAEHGPVSRAVKQVRQFMCGLHGHDSLLHFESGRISLQCTSCGHETPGWDINRTVARAAEAAPKAGVLRLPIIHERRVA